MAGVQAHMRSFYPLHGSGRCAPTLLQDLTLHSPEFGLRTHQEHDILRDPPLRFTHGKAALGGFLNPKSCQHTFWIKQRQTSLPELDDRPGPDAKWNLAAICGKCRIHLNVKIDYSDGWQPAPCPNPENPLHHFIRTEWREGNERRVWENGMLGSESDISVYQCSAETCSAVVTVRYTPQQIGDDLLHILTDPEQLKQRTDAAFKANEGNTQGMKPPTVLDVLSDLRIYLTNSWNAGEQTRRDIKMTNRRFVVRFGPNGDACKDLLEFFRFRRDEANQSWHVPQPNMDDSVPIRDPLNVFLDDVEHELLALMLNRPREETATYSNLSTGVPAAREMQRLLSAQDYDTIMFRTVAIDPVLRMRPYVGLGTIPNFADHLIIYAYKRQIAHDPFNIPLYFEFLRDIALERRSDILQTEVGVEESIGRFTAAALDQAHAAFNVGRQDRVDDDHIIGLFQSRVMDMPAQESQLRSHLRIIGSWRNSSKILAVADNVMDTHEQALQFLGADASVSDDHIPALFTVKTTENIAFEEQAKKAVRLIANHRNSRLLKRWIDSGFSGDLSMDAADGYQALNIDDRQLEDDIVKSAYDMAILDYPEQTEYYRKALEAIAIDRNSGILRDHLQGSAPGGMDAPGNSEEPVGLDNIGNTCYLNSLLQFLFTLVELRQIVLNFDEYKMEVTEDTVRDKKVGQRKVTKREVQSAQAFVASLGQLFKGMIETPSSTIKPDKELARLTLETHGAKEKLRRRSTLMSDRPSLGNLDSQQVVQTLPGAKEDPLATVDDTEIVQSPELEEPVAMSIDDGNISETIRTPTSENSSEATLVSRPGTPGTPVINGETIEQQQELLANKENLSPTKLDISPKHGDVEMTHPQPLAPASPSKVNVQAGALAQRNKDADDHAMSENFIEATPKYMPPPGKPPPVPPRKPLEPSTDILEEYARQQDVTEVIAHCLFQFSCAIRGTGKDASGEQEDELHDIFFGQNISHTVPEVDKPTPIQFNNIITRVANKPKDVYEALDSEYDLSEREGGSKAFMSISKLPPVFSMALDRVAWDKVARRPTKQDDYVQVPETIFLDRYLEAPPDSELMQRRQQAWSMKSELVSLTKRRDRLEEKVANGRDIPTLFADAKMALEYLQSNPDFATPDAGLDEIADNLDPVAGLLGLLAEDLAAELKTIHDRIAHLQQQLKESFADMRKHPYRLHAAFFHRGGATGGHYWVYIYDHNKECWRRYNDDRVNVVDNRNEIFGKPDSPFATPNPYFLVYVREEQLDKLVQTVKRDIVYPIPQGPPPQQEWDEEYSGQGWDQPPQSQLQALPPHSADHEMVEVNGGIGAWAGGESSEQIPAQSDVPGKLGDWDDHELITSRKVDWSG